MSMAAGDHRSYVATLMAVGRANGPPPPQQNLMAVGLLAKAVTAASPVGQIGTPSMDTSGVMMDMELMEITATRGLLLRAVDVATAVAIAAAAGFMAHRAASSRDRQGRRNTFLPVVGCEPIVEDLAMVLVR